MRRPFVAANWKLNGDRTMAARLIGETVAGIGTYDGCDVVVCPPCTLLHIANDALTNTCIELGAQNVSDQSDGAYTGEVSANMLKEAGCNWVIIGHSERRHTYHESDNLVAEKVARATSSGLKPIICVGELLSERESGETAQVVLRQLRAVTNRVGVDALASAIIAYEPVWAIGTGKTATAEQAQEVHQMLRNDLSSLSETVAMHIRIVYGGSVKPENASELFAQNDIDGGLIGGASLKADQFVPIVKATAE